MHAQISPPPPLTCSLHLQATEKEPPLQNRETVSATPSTPDTCFPPLAYMYPCQQIKACG